MYWLLFIPPCIESEWGFGLFELQSKKKKKKNEKKKMF